MSPKLLKKLGLVIGVFAGIIILLFLFSSCSKGGGSSKLSSIRTDMVAAAYKYYQTKDHKDDLPQDDGASTSITLKKIIQEGYMGEPTSAYNDDSIKCSGEVFIENNNGHYLYTPYVECKSDIEKNNINTIYLKDKIIEDQLVEKSVGLYAVGNAYVERGEVTNNYVSIDDKLYRIIRINEDGTIKVISLEESYTTWDNRYNLDQKNNDGKNDFIVNDINSRLNEKLIKLYDKTSDKMKAYISTQNLCIGKRSIADTTSDGSTECSQTTKTQFGALAVYEYLQSSLDPECNSLTSRSCKNYNWLATEKLASWSITADLETSYKAYEIRNLIRLKTCNSSNSLKPTFTLSSNVLYKEGSGTEKDPYILRYYPVGKELEEAKKEKKKKSTDN